MKKLTIVAALSFIVCAPLAHADSDTPACTPLVHVVQVCGRNLLSVEENIPGAGTPEDIENLKTLIGPTGVSGSIRAGVLAHGAAATNAHCADPSLRISTVQGSEGTAAAIRMMGGDASPCLAAVGELQNGTSVQ